MARRRGWGSIVFRDGRAYAQITLDGRRTMRALYLSDDRTPCPADQALAEDAIQRLRAGLSAPVTEAPATTLDDWLDREYSDVLAGRLTPRVARQNEAYIVRFADWCEADLGPGATMDQVDRAAAERFVAAFLANRLPRVRGSRLRERYKASYLRRVVNTLRRAWFDAAERGYVDRNPWSRLRLPRIESTTVPWVSPEDLDRLVAAVNRHQRPVIALIVWTGLRISEVLALRRDDVDLERALLHVRTGKTAGARRTVPLTTPALEVLRALPRRKDGMLLRPRAQQATLRALKTACRHAGLPLLTHHKLRHVFASHLAVAGTSPRDLASLLGHVDGGVLATRLYGRWFPPDSERRATKRLETFRATRGSGGG